VDPVGADEVLIAKAKEAGARVRYPAEITGLDAPGGTLRAVRTPDGELEADVLVIACGTDTPRIAAMAGLQVPLKPSPGVLVHTTPQQPLLGRVVLSPIAHMKQKPDGRIVTGSGFGGTPNTDTSLETGQRFLGQAAAVLPLFGSMRVERVTLGWRPLPKDEYPVVGFPKGRRDVYITVMHSGMTLSPLIAKLAAAEILDGVEVDMLSPYRLERFGA
jgi:glycine/D-amino acid oxidase-like deaminating enzyme